MVSRELFRFASWVGLCLCLLPAGLKASELQLCAKQGVVYGSALGKVKASVSYRDGWMLKRLDSPSSLALPDAAGHDRCDSQARMSEQQLTATVYFDFDKAKLSKASRQVLAQLSPEDFSEVIAVEGHTCSLGSDSYNLALATRRAEGVRDAMQHEAFFDRRFVVKSYGKSMPIADNASEHGRALNRRVEIRSQR